MKIDRFKYRAWHKKEKRWLTTMILDAMAGRVPGFGDDEIALQQCTGLRDRNGNLIFEGDIVRLHLESDVKEDDYEDLEVRYDEDFLCWVLYDKIHDFCDDSGLGADEFKSEDFEIIGNINEGLKEHADVQS